MKKTLAIIEPLHLSPELYACRQNSYCLSTFCKPYLCNPGSLLGKYQVIEDTSQARNDLGTCKLNTMPSLIVNWKLYVLNSTKKCCSCFLKSAILHERKEDVTSPNNITFFRRRAAVELVPALDFRAETKAETPNIRQKFTSVAFRFHGYRDSPTRDR